MDIDKTTSTTISTGDLPERYPRTTLKGFRKGFPECETEGCTRMRTRGTLHCVEHHKKMKKV